MHRAGGGGKGQEGTTTCGLEIQSCNEWNAQGKGAVEVVGEVVVADQGACRRREERARASRRARAVHFSA